ncbi:MAG TPA: Gfo/Idh/MocA family oxidoreductase, partial [Streptosporangiaceae bacterium]
MSEHGGTGPGPGQHGLGKHGLGIVGGGVIGAFHAQAAAMVPGARLVAVTDVLPDRAKAFAVEHGCAAESSLGDLLSRGDIDVVSVCVPSGLHAEVGI